MRLTAAACCELAAAHSASEITRVDASNKEVEEVDDLSSLTSLVRLDLSDNPLRSLEEVLESTRATLKHLVAARCPGISSPPPSSTSTSTSSSIPPPPLPLLLPPPSRLRLPQLRVLDLSSCGISSFDASAAPKLSALILTGNAELKQIVGLSKCFELATLVVKNCALDDAALSRALRGVSTVSKLSAAHNRLRGGKRLDLSALRGSLSELRLGHNDVEALPSGLGPRLRLLDLGGNERLGPLSRVVGELSSICGGSGVGGGSGVVGGGGKGSARSSSSSSWLRSVTLRGTAASRERGYKRAVASAVPALRVLDDKRVDLAGFGLDDDDDGEGGEVERKQKKTTRKGKEAKGDDDDADDGDGGDSDDDDDDDEERRRRQRRRLSRAGPAPGEEDDDEREEEEQARKKEKKKEQKKKKKIAVGRLADEVGLGGDDEEEKQTLLPPPPPPPLLSSSRLPPPPPPATPVPGKQQQRHQQQQQQQRGSAAVAVIEVKKDKKQKKQNKRSDDDGRGNGDDGGNNSAVAPVATGKDAAALLRASASAISPMDDLDYVGGW